jgi:hypothetical protein
MKKKAAFISAVILALLIGCIPNLKNISRDKCTAMPNDNVVKALQDNCIKCHSKDFSTKQDICGLRGRIIEQVRTGKMPKIGKLWPSYYKTIVEWK